MEDAKIVELFWDRDQTAIEKSNEKYGRYCYAIAYRILCSREDSEECINDTWHNAWRAIPPERPGNLQAYFGCITRNLALSRCDYRNAKKRKARLETAMDEYWQCIPNGDLPLDDEMVMKDLINRFLGSLDQRSRIVFLRRYWYICSVKEIADGMGLSQSNVNVILHRTRNKFKLYLQEEGVCV